MAGVGVAGPAGRPGAGDDREGREAEHRRGQPQRHGQRPPVPDRGHGRPVGRHRAPVLRRRRRRVLVLVLVLLVVIEVRLAEAQRRRGGLLGAVEWRHRDRPLRRGRGLGRERPLRRRPDEPRRQPELRPRRRRGRLLPVLAGGGGGGRRQEVRRGRAWEMGGRTDR